MHWDEDTDVSGPADVRKDAGKRDKACLIVIAGSKVGEMFPLESAATLGRGVEADIRLTDDGISRAHCRITRDGDQLVLEDLGSRNGTYWNGEPVERHALADGDKIQLGRTTILKFTYHDRLEESFQRQMFDSALRDPLTQVYNKRYFENRLTSELRYARRHGTPLALLLIDLDRFKEVNDSRGHLAGDKALVTVAAHVQSTIRNEDVFSRIGGEEFAIISRGIRRDQAELFAERLRAQIAELEIVHDETRFRMTTSIGIATLPENDCDDSQELVEAADRALYAAKDAGRDRVALAKG